MTAVATANCMNKVGGNGGTNGGGHRFKSGTRDKTGRKGAQCSVVSQFEVVRPFEC